MNFNNFTIKSQELIEQSAQSARTLHNQSVEPEHLLYTMITKDDAVTRYLLQKLEASPQHIVNSLDNEIKRLPQVSGGDTYISNRLNQVFNNALAFAQDSGDQYVTIEALLYALLSVESPASKALLTLPKICPAFDKASSSSVENCPTFLISILFFSFYI